MSGRAGIAATWAVALALLVVAGAGARPALTALITSYPSDPTTATEATFVFSADARDAVFACSLDGARATSCTSPIRYSGLALGQHKFALTAARGRERASLSHTWTIVPPAPRRQWLVVVVDGAGSVLSSPAGIACPGDCLEALADGTRVTLTASPGSGHELERWSGGCTGTGACSVTVGPQTFVKASFVPTAKPRVPTSLDLDRDGVPALRDDCSETVPWAEPLLYGCSLPDLLRGRDGGLLDDVYDFPGEYAQRFVGISKLKPVFRDLLQGISRIRKGAGLVEQGEVCKGAAAIGSGAEVLRMTTRKSSRIVAGLQASLTRAPSGGADAGVDDLRWAGARYRQGLVKTLSRDAARLRKVFAAACRGMGGRGTFVGVVAEIDAAGGQLRMKGGRRFALPNGGFGGSGLAEGARARIVARAAPGSPAVVESATGLDFGKIGKIEVPCVSLRIAPPQDFTKPSPVVHDPLGYFGYSNRYWLEEYVRWAATPECPKGDEARFSLHVVFTAPGELPKTIVDLTADDGAVARHIEPGPKTWTITVTERRQGHNCQTGDQPAPVTFEPTSATEPAAIRSPLSPAKSYPCPVVDVSTTVYKAQVRAPTTLFRSNRKSVV